MPFTPKYDTSKGSMADQLAKQFGGQSAEPAPSPSPSTSQSDDSSPNLKSESGLAAMQRRLSK